jgi:GNAT superfamily N-acetyltransferase
MLTIAQVASPADIAAVQELITEYTTWALTSLVGDSERPPTFEGVEEEIAALPGIFAPPAGRLLLARHDGQPAGCIALKPHPDGVAELKRLYVRPGFRGLALGRQLVAAIVQAARDSGYRRMILDSHISMTHAHALYREAGFRDVPPPPDFPAELAPEIVFMEMELA